MPQLKKDYNGFLKMKSDPESLNLALSSIPLFSGLATECLSSLSAYCRVYRYPKSETVFRKGDPSQGFYYVLEGKVKLYFVSERGTEKILEVLTPGMTFGEAMAFIEQPFPVFAETMARSSLLFVQKEGLFSAVRDHPQMAMRMLSGLSRRMHSLVDVVESLCVMSSRERVIGFLLAELEKRGNIRGAVELPATKAVVASLLNLTPETFSRILHSLEKDRVVHIRGRHVEVLDPDKLRSCSSC